MIAYGYVYLTVSGINDSNNTWDRREGGFRIILILSNIYTTEVVYT